MEPVIPQPGNVFVNNAGVVLLNSFFPALFERLGIMSGHHFIDNNAHIKGAQYLHYLATGCGNTANDNLSLNKVLCGLPLSAVIPGSIETTPEQKEHIEGLLSFAIKRWEAIGDCSVAAFRENWLIRNGMLSEDAAQWNLTVDKKPYDVLISKSPFSFSVIRHPWMNKPLHVHWAF
jgi:hypothetical protein